MQRAGVTPRYVEVAGQRLRYVRRGNGRPLILVHGFSSSIYTWAEALPLLAERHDVIAVDLPGFGGSDVPARFDSRRLGGAAGARHGGAWQVPRASLAGNSLGGALAAVTAARHPDRVDRLVLLDAAAYNFAQEDRPPLLRLAARLPGVGCWTRIPQRPLMRSGLKQVYFDDSLVTPERLEEYLAPMARPGAQAAARRLLREGDGFGLPGVLRQVRAPTLVIWGADDTWIPVARCRPLRARHPGRAQGGAGALRPRAAGREARRSRAAHRRLLAAAGSERLLLVEGDQGLARLFRDRAFGVLLDHLLQRRAAVVAAAPGQVVLAQHVEDLGVVGVGGQQEAPFSTRSASPYFFCVFRMAPSSMRVCLRSWSGRCPSTLAARARSWPLSVSASCSNRCTPRPASASGSSGRLLQLVLPGHDALGARPAPLSMCAGTGPGPGSR